MPAIAVIAAFSGFAVLWFTDREGYTLVMKLLGVDAWEFPFLDLWGVLASIECHRQGFDVFLENPCDPLHRLHSYSPLWLYLPIPTPVRLLVPLGIASSVAFAAVVTAVLRPRSRRETIVLTLAAVSPVSIFALERANVDVIIFALLALAAWLLSRRFAVRACAYALILSMALLKFYPAAALVSAARERPRATATIALFSIFAGTALFSAFPHEMMLIPTMAAHGPIFNGFFGAKNLPSGLAVFLTGGFDELSAGGITMPLFLGMLCIWGAALVLFTRRLHPIGNQLSMFDRDLLLVGSSIVAGCFFLGQNITYRLVFLLLAIPGLVRSARVERSLSFASYGALLLLWSDFTTKYVFIFAPRMVSFVYWIARETLWWTVVAVLGAVVARHLADRWSQIVSDKRLAESQ